MRLKSIAAVVLAATLGLAATGCSSDSNSDENTSDVVANPTFESGTTMQRLAEAGTVKVGTKVDQPGFGMNNLEGKPEGFDVEIAKLIAGQLGISSSKIEWVETPSAVREEYIEQGKVDYIVATYTINDKRKERVDFAGPYYEAGQAIMVRKNDNSIKGPDDFKNGNKKVCSITGSTPAEKIKEYVKDQASQLVLFDTYDKCRDALKNNQVDAVTTDNVILLGYISQDPDAFKLVGTTFTKEPYGVGLKKGDDKFRDFINDTLEKISSDGRYEEAWKETAGKFDKNTPTMPELNRY